MKRKMKKRKTNVKNKKKGAMGYVCHLLRPGGGFESRVLAIAILRGFPVKVDQWVVDGEERAHDRWRDCHRSCVRDAPGGGAFLPPASCCSFSSFALRLHCLVLEIGHSGIFGVVVVVLVVVVRLGAATGSFDWLLVHVRCLLFA